MNFGKFIKRVKDFLANKAFNIAFKMAQQRASILAKDNRGSVDVVDLILLGVGIFVISYLFPMGITAAVSANTDLWDPTLVTLWTVFWPLMSILAAVIYLIYKIKN